MKGGSMDGINFSNNIFATYPANYNSKQKTPLSVVGKDILNNNDNEADKEISMYLDILYNDSNEDILNKTDKMKLNGAYSPIKNQNLNYGKFFI